jgi:filamentous hemagglutinin family protein
VLQTLAFSASSTLAQELKPVADNTLGAESSVVTPTSPQADRIHGGAIRGANLFHSFSQFNIGEGREAYFANPSGIENILSRVTGSDASRIFGKLGVLGNANLFLINPNGIIFGRNASLDVRGSFVASTASSLKFADGIEFSAKAAQSTPLLTVSIPLGLQYGTNPGKIQVQGDGQGVRSTSELIDTTSGLRVQPNQTLALVGGDVSLERATLNTAGGRIELGSVGDNSLVSLTPINKGFTLGYDSVQNFGNIQLSQQTAVDASGAGGGDIQVTGRRVTLSNGSQILASTLAAERGGALIVNATESVEVIGLSANGQFNSGLFAQAYPDTTGDAGDLTINTYQLLVSDGAQVDVSTFGAGKGGNLTVKADSVQLIGRSADGQISSLLAASAQPGATGVAGDLTINTRVLLVRDGAQVGTSTYGAGKAGNLTVKADSVQLIGISTDGKFPSALGASSAPGETGAAGDLTINTRVLLVRDGAQALAATFGSGNGGSLNVNASESVQLIGTSADGQFRSGLITGTRGTGEAGDLTINTRQLLLRDGAQVSADTFGTGKGGNLTVNATDSVQMIGESTNGEFSSSLSARASSRVTGDAGDLTINTRQLLLRDGAQVDVGTFGAGKGGNLTVNATDSVQVIGYSADSQFPTGLFTQTTRNATGDAGDLTINTRQLLLQDGGQVSAGTFSAGKGGNLTVNADTMQLIGSAANGQFTSGLFTQTTRNATGDAGDLMINTRELLVRDGAGVFVRSLGTGNAGNLTVDARSIRLDNNATLTADTRSQLTDPNQEQATINLRVKDLLLLSRGSNITTNARGENVIGGNININTDFLVAVKDSDISANSANFRGGRVIINATGIFGTQFRDAPTRESDITATGASPEYRGNVEINTPDIDPNTGVINLPSVPVDTELAQGCNSPNYAQSSFIITGRGGLPPNPKDILTPDAVQVDWVTLNPEIDKNSRTNISTNPNTTPPAPIVEATGWVFGPKGEVIFTAQAPTQQQNSWQTSPKCHEK